MKKLWILGIFLLSQSAFAYDFDSWQYNSGRDKFNDEEYSSAYSSGVNYKYDNKFTIGFYCKSGRVRFEISADTPIQSKGRPFSFTYRVDKRSAQEIQMNTFSNEGQGGYTYDDAEKVAKDILGGSSIYVRAITWDNEYLETNITLKSSDINIKKVFSDCGSSLEDGSTSYGYNWAAPCDTIKSATIENVLKTKPSEIRGLSEDDYFSAECHINDDKYFYVNQVERYVLLVMRNGTTEQAEKAKNILEQLSNYEKKILPRIIGGVPMPKKEAQEIRLKIKELNTEISTIKESATARYIESDRFWNWFLGK
ncbi:MAG: hypothetical protein PF482_06560 [Desulfobacteraceae bacterium]|jgi:hypothetical protein|nr:hypothetical protein [Desulfobacteraceae bacterium]